MLRRFALGTAAALAGIAAPAGATVFTVTFYGNAHEVNTYAQSGASTGKYSNVAYTSVYTIDDSKGTEFKNSYESYFTGGITAVVTLAGIGSWTIDGSGNNDFDTRNDQAGTGDSINGQIGVSVNDFSTPGYWHYVSGSTYDYFIAPVNGPYNTTDFRQPMDYTMQPGDAVGSSFTYLDQLYNLNSNMFESYTNVSAFIDMQRVVVSGSTTTPTNPPTSAVPEPATWAMMIAGFGLVGGAMRRRVAVSFSPRFQ